MKSNLKNTNLKTIAAAILTLISIPTNSRAASLVLSDLSYGYSNCSAIDNNNGTASFFTTIRYKDSHLHSGRYNFLSRGVMFYTYNSLGNPTLSFSGKTQLNSIQGTSYSGSGNYVLYHGVVGLNQETLPEWSTPSAFAPNIKITIPISIIKEWPAISIRAGNYTTGEPVGDSKGAAYIHLDDGKQGTCRITTTPETPPPADTKINISAPDWNLGELPPGDSQKTLTSKSEQLCFSYNSSSDTNKLYVINAHSFNGISNNRYQLRNLQDSSQVIPYRLMLFDGKNIPQVLPNTSNTTIRPDASGNTCFTPTFSTSVDKNQKEGDYFDVLTFTVVTKP